MKTKRERGKMQEKKQLKSKTISPNKIQVYHYFLPKLFYFLEKSKFPKQIKNEVSMMHAIRNPVS